MNTDNKDKWVWFDLDDTLIDFTTNAHTALVRLYYNFGLGEWFRTVDRWVDMYESHNAALWDRYSHSEITREHLRLDRFMHPFTQAGVQHDVALEMSSRFDTLYLDYLAEERQLIDGALEVLAAFRERGYGIGVLSNGFSEVQHRKIKRAGLATYIDITVLSDDIGVTKPHRALFDHAVSLTRQPSPGCHTMVGDNPMTDIAGALGAGWNAIWLDSPRAGHDTLATPCGARRIASLRELL